MRLINAQIYGFGKWTDETFTFNEHGLTCITGDNESGKSTFQAFISFVLFGLRPKERAFYRPKTSGTIGGQLGVVDKDGESFTIRRVDGQQNGAAICMFPNGETKDEEWLNDQLKGMNASLFASTFLFTTKDLAIFEQIESDQIGKVLLHTSISGAPHLSRLEKKLERNMDELFKPRGERPTINAQLNVVERMHKQLLDHAQMAEKHQRLTEKIEQAKTNMDHMQIQLQQEKKQNITWKQLETALPFLQQYERAKEAYGDEKPIFFPTKGIERMEEKQHIKKQYNSNMTIIQQNIDRYTIEMENVSMLQADTEEEARSILQAKEDWTYMLRTVNELKKETEVIQAEMTTRLEPFLHSIPEAYVDDMRLQPFVEKKWSDFAKQADAFDQMRIGRQRALEDEVMKRTSIEKQMKILEADLLTDEQLSERKKQLTLADEGRTNQTLIESIKNQEKEVRQKAEQTYKKANHILIGTHVVAVLFLFCAFIFTFPLLVHGAILSSAFGFIQWIGARRLFGKQTTSTLITPLEPSTHLTEAERSILEESIRAHEFASESIAHLIQQLGEVDRTIINRQKQLDELLQDEQVLNEQIEEHVQMYPFLDKIELPYWGEVGYVLRDVHVLKHKIMGIEERIATKEEHVHHFEQRVLSWWEEQGEVRTIDSIESLVIEIERVIRHHEQQQQQYQMAKSEKEEAMREKTALEEKRTQINAEIASLLDEAAVETEESFVTRYEKMLDQLNVQREVDEAKQQLIHIFSPSTWQTYVDKGIDAHTIDFERMKSEDTIEELEENIEKERAVLASSSAEIKQMERTDSRFFSERMHQFEVEKASLHALAKQWATYQVARSTLEQAKQSYMETHVTEVVNRTAEHFSFLTNNRYQMIYIDAATDTLTVRDRNHIEYMVDELSKGTRDQLYISLRLAMSERIHEKTPYPFLFDDSFVHFDQKRTERMIQLIVQIARREQVLLFTCKPEIEEIVKEHTASEELSWIRIH